MRFITRSSGIQISWTHDDSSEAKEIAFHYVELLRIMVMLSQRTSPTAESCLSLHNGVFTSNTEEAK